MASKLHRDRSQHLLGPAFFAGKLPACTPPFEEVPGGNQRLVYWYKPYLKSEYFFAINHLIRGHRTMTHSHVGGKILLCKVRAAFHGDRAWSSATSCATGALQDNEGSTRVRAPSFGEGFCHPGGASPRSGLSPVARRLWFQLRYSWQPAPELVRGPKKTRQIQSNW